MSGCAQTVRRSDSRHQAESEVVRERLQGRSSCAMYRRVLLHVLCVSNADCHVWRFARRRYRQLHRTFLCQSPCLQGRNHKFILGVLFGGVFV